MTQENKRDLVEKEQDRLWENKKLSDIEKIIADMIKGDNAPYRSYVTYWNRRAYHLNVLFFQEFAKKIIQKIRKEIEKELPKFIFEDQSTNAIMRNINKILVKFGVGN